jgi:hypothetical protein
VRTRRRVGKQLAVLPRQTRIWHEAEQPEIKRLSRFAIALAVADVEVHVLQQRDAGRRGAVPERVVGGGGGLRRMVGRGLQVAGCGAEAARRRCAVAGDEAQRRAGGRAVACWLALRP